MTASGTARACLRAPQPHELARANLAASRGLRVRIPQPYFLRPHMNSSTMLLLGGRPMQARMPHCLHRV